MEFTERNRTRVEGIEIRNAPSAHNQYAILWNIPLCNSLNLFSNRFHIVPSKYIQLSDYRSQLVSSKQGKSM